MVVPNASTQSRAVSQLRDLWCMFNARRAGDEDSGSRLCSWTVFGLGGSGHILCVEKSFGWTKYYRASESISQVIRRGSRYEGNANSRATRQGVFELPTLFLVLGSRTLKLM